ncbi:MAG: RNA polymerase sigma factor [Clostridiales bacterium]|nr:RNA polymerase sigma factor [Clostridiales bacterium]
MDELFEKLYGEYFDRVYSFLFNMTRDADLSEDLTQETFFQAFVSFHRFEGKCEIFTWLASIAKHTYYKYLRKRRLGFHAIDITELENYLLDDDLSHNPADACMQKDMRQTVSGFVGRLSDKYRDVVLLRIYADMPFSQVAAALGITENSAKVIFFRAKKMLSEDLKHELTV